MTRTDAPAAWHLAYVGLGANLGQPAATLSQALRQLGTLPHTELTAQSSLYRSAPLDAGGPDYVNAVARLRTGLSAPALLAALLELEAAAGRQRPYRHAPRTLDLDLLLYDTLRLQSPELTLPHPRMHQRAFVLAPLAELAPDLSLEPHGTVRALLAGLQATQDCQRLEPESREP